ncbi:DNA polymerase III subunit beta [Vibrio metoecus]
MMKLTFKTKELLLGLDFVGISDKNTGDIGYIDQVFFKVSNKVCQLHRFGIGLSKTSPFIPCLSTDVEGSFDCQINYEALHAIVKKIASRFEEMSLSICDGESSKQILLEAGRLTTKLNVTSFAEPPEPKLLIQNEICVLKHELERIIRRAKVASAINDIRYVLNGILLTTDDAANLRAVGCDGHRLALAKCSYLAHIYQHHELIISTNGVRYLESLIRIAEEETLVLHFDSSYLCISLKNGARLKMSVIDGRYPDWRRVIPLQTQRSITLEREELISSIQSAAPITQQKFRTARFEIASSGVTIRTKSDVGDFVDVVEAKAYSGDSKDSMEIGVNIDFLQSALSALDSEQVSLEFVGVNSGFLIKEVCKDANGIQVVMPVR